MIFLKVSAALSQHVKNLGLALPVVLDRSEKSVSFCDVDYCEWLLGLPALRLHCDAPYRGSFQLQFDRCFVQCYL